MLTPRANRVCTDTGKETKIQTTLNQPFAAPLRTKQTDQHKLSYFKSVHLYFEHIEQERTNEQHRRFLVWHACECVFVFAAVCMY